MNKSSQISTPRYYALCALITVVAYLGGPPQGHSQLTGLENGEWQYLTGDAGSTRSAPMLNQINADNFSDLEVAWIWRGDNFGPGVETPCVQRQSTPMACFTR